MARTFKAVLRAIRLLLEVTTFVLVLSFVFVVLLAVVYRYVLNASLPWSEEFIRFSLFWCILITSILVTWDNDHLRIEAIQLVLPPKLRKFCIISSHLVTIGFCIFLGYHALDLVSRTTATSPALHLPMRWVYAAMIGGAVGIGLAALGNLVQAIRSKVTP